MIDGLSVTPLDIIDVTGGNVLHIIKASDKSYSGFGEAYFSTVDYGVIRGWKRNRDMRLNLVVPVGSVRFVAYDNRNKSSKVVHISSQIVDKEFLTNLKDKLEETISLLNKLKD